jgi:hypothetical protein
VTKQEIIEVIQELPDNVTAHQVIEAIRFRERNFQAMASIRAGKGIPHEEIDKMVDEWLQEEE